MSQSKDLNTLMKSEFVLAKRLYLAETCTRFVLGAVAISALIWPERFRTAVVLVGFMMPLLGLLLREIGGHFYSRGEGLRRLYLLREGTGHEPQEAEILEILGEARGPSQAEPEPLGGYYTSRLEAGSQRLVHLLQESSFWTAGQARLTMRVHFVVAGAGVLASLILVVLVLPQLGVTPGTPVVDYQRLFTTLLLFFVSSATFPTALAYRNLTLKATEVMRTASRLRRETTVDAIALYRVLSVYDCALATTPPLPGYSYRLKRKTLNEAWLAVQREIESPKS